MKTNAANSAVASRCDTNIHTVAHEHREPAGLAIAGGSLRIDLDAIMQNYRHIRQLVQPADCAAVLKANAYGLGVRFVAPALYAAGCRHFFVAQMNEALVLREYVALDANILVLNGISPSAMPMASAHSITPVLNSLVQAIAWTRQLQAQGIRRPVVLQVDTGMTRLGLMPDEIEAFAAIVATEQLQPPRLLMSHMASADVPDDAYCEQQRQSLLHAARHFPGIRLSLANSAGCFMGADYTFDLCRPGAALFGIQVSTRSPTMRAAVQLNLRIAQIREVPAGVTVGYGRSFTTDRPSRIATISAGYADGIPRNLSPAAGVWSGAQKMPVVGRVCMDSFMVDATDIASNHLHEGQWVEFLGPHQTLEAVAAAAGTIGYEILTRLGQRYAQTITPLPCGQECGVLHQSRLAIDNAAL